MIITHCFKESNRVVIELYCVLLLYQLIKLFHYYMVFLSETQTHTHTHTHTHTPQYKQHDTRTCCRSPMHIYSSNGFKRFLAMHDVHSDVESHIDSSFTSFIRIMCTHTRNRRYSSHHHSLRSHHTSRNIYETIPSIEDHNLQQSGFVSLTDTRTSPHTESSVRSCANIHEIIVTHHIDILYVHTILKKHRHHFKYRRA